MSAVLTTYNTDECEELIKHFSKSPQKFILYLYNIFGDLIYQFPLTSARITTIKIPCPTRDYFVAKIFSPSQRKHHYVILKPEGEPDRYLFVLKPKSEVVTIKGEDAFSRRKLVFLFPDLGYCDISDLDAGKYVLETGTTILGFEVKTPVYAIQ